MEQRLAELDALCRQKEEERVELELQLTEVKENLKKSLASGALGPPTDTRIIVKVGCSTCTVCKCAHVHLFKYSVNTHIQCINYIMCIYVCVCVCRPKGPK